MNQEEYLFEVSSEEEGQRLDIFIKKKFQSYTLRQNLLPSKIEMDLKLNN